MAPSPDTRGRRRSPPGPTLRSQAAGAAWTLLLPTLELGDVLCVGRPPPPTVRTLSAPGRPGRRRLPAAAPSRAPRRHPGDLPDLGAATAHPVADNRHVAESLGRRRPSGLPGLGGGRARRPAAVGRLPLHAQLRGDRGPRGRRLPRAGRGPPPTARRPAAQPDA